MKTIPFLNLYVSECSSTTKPKPDDCWVKAIFFINDSILIICLVQWFFKSGHGERKDEVC